MIVPKLLAWVKKRLFCPGVRIDTGLMMGLGRVARPATQRSVVWTIGATARAWNDVFDVKGVRRDVLWSTAVFTTAPGPPLDQLPLHRRTKKVSALTDGGVRTGFF